MLVVTCKSIRTNDGILDPLSAIGENQKCQQPHGEVSNTELGQMDYIFEIRGPKNPRVGSTGCRSVIGVARYCSCHPSLLSVDVCRLLVPLGPLSLLAAATSARHLISRRHVALVGASVRACTTQAQDFY
ncbi:hypothetical protein ACLOJK_013179, partial [Asimina triloba]